MESPIISVVMAVYNERPYLEAAVQSILDQTFTDFEFIIVNDGSTDGTKEALERFADQDDRIRLLHQENRGLIVSLNRGLSAARGSLIARMDGDDISHPERFERQVEFLRTHPKIGGVGTRVDYIDRDGQVTGGKWPSSIDPDVITWNLLFGACLCHPTVMVRRTLLNELRGYAEWARFAEDYELWTRAVQRSQLANLPDTFLRRRRHEGSVTVARRTEQVCTCEEVATKFHQALLGRQVENRRAAFVVWMAAEGIDRAVEETGVQDFAAMHKYVRTLYGACARQLLSDGSNVRVRQQALPKLDAIAERIAEREGWRAGLRHKVWARCMAPRRETLPWAIQALRRRIA